MEHDGVGPTVLPSGIYELVMDERLAEAVAALDPSCFDVDTRSLDPGDSHALLARHLCGLLLRRLQECSGERRLAQQVELCNAILGLVRREGEGLLPDAGALRCLLAVLQRPQAHPPVSVPRPDTPLSLGCLLTGTRDDPSLVSQLKKEMLSADRVDILCSFIRWTGVRIIQQELRELTSRPGSRLRVITTSYMGATDAKAVEFLSELPRTSVRISYDTEHTRLHAKAYLFHRESGFGTAYIGSANLSRAALTEGLEWTVKISQAEQSYLWDKTVGTFETYWYGEDRQFEDYAAPQRERLRRALQSQRSAGEDHGAAFFDIQPYPYQREILERLAAERELQRRRRHLVVAATGTGKTVVAAFDFKNWRALRRELDPDQDPRLLFIAHREEILAQSLSTFRGILRDANFGDLMVGGHEPASRDHLFLSIQTFNSQDMASSIPADYYDYVIVDEFHHAAAPSYRRLLEHLRPQVLLGLTATPERADSLDVLSHFDNHISAELRLPDAINRALLSPFHYFCVTDLVDLSGVRWQRGGYPSQDLDGLYTGNDARAGLVIEKVHEYLLDPHSARALGFCVSVAHAQYMARKFREAGLAAESLCGDSPAEVRRDAQRRLRDGVTNFVFTVDLYNEGVDIPEVDTVLFLRPTESLTVFLQQLGRGLRRCQDKECLTVLDFVGQAHRNYRFDLRFRALLSGRRGSVAEEIEQQFPHLPAGCSLQMERVAAQHILQNVRQAVQAGTRPQLLRHIADFEQETGRLLTLRGFLQYHGLEVDDVLRRGPWSRLCAMAGVGGQLSDPDEALLARGLRRLGHIDDSDWITTLMDVLGREGPELRQLLADTDVQRRVLMMHFSLWGTRLAVDNLEGSVQRLRANPALFQELRDLLSLRFEAVQSVTRPADLPFPCPLRLHATYTRDEVLAALGHWTLDRQPDMREGVLHLRQLPADLFLVTLNKTERHYSPTTMYQDYALSERLFHWQSQSTTAETSPTGQRYINHKRREHTILLAVRENREERGLSCPYYFLGPAEYVSHEKSRPMNITWSLRHPLPAHLLRVAERLAAG